MKPLLTTLWSLHHLVRAWRQIEDFFGVGFGEMCEQIADPDQPSDASVFDDRKRSVMVLLHDCNCLADRPARADCAGTAAEKSRAERLVPIEPVVHALRQDIALCEDAGKTVPIHHEHARPRTVMHQLDRFADGSRRRHEYGLLKRELLQRLVNEPAESGTVHRSPD
jgi:hypothetical protein